MPFSIGKEVPRTGRIKISRESQPSTPDQSTAVNTDDNLLQISLNRWQCSEWKSLSELDGLSLENHPDGAKLSLLAGAAYLRQGNRLKAEKALILSKNLGINKNLISRMLISGVHDTLGRACLMAESPSRAAKHFQLSDEIGFLGNASVTAPHLRNQGNTGKSPLLDRIRTAKPKIPSHPEVPKCQINSNLICKSILEESKKISLDFKVNIKQVREEIWKIKSSLEKSLANETRKATKQIEAFIEVQSYLTTGKLIGEFHGWPISPDFALQIIKLLETEDYDLIVEFGSGTSTILIAKALRIQKEKRQLNKRVKQIAFEHLNEFFLNTRKLLNKECLDASVDLFHTPLAQHISANGEVYQYYSCENVLDELPFKSANNLKILVVIDGPPSTTGRYARYPALPIVMKRFPNAEIDFLLDDYNRLEETEIVQKWKNELSTMDVHYQASDIGLEKGAALISIRLR